MLLLIHVGWDFVLLSVRFGKMKRPSLASDSRSTRAYSRTDLYKTISMPGTRNTRLCSTTAPQIESFHDVSNISSCASNQHNYRNHRVIKPYLMAIKNNLHAWHRLRKNKTLPKMLKSPSRTITVLIDSFQGSREYPQKMHRYYYTHDTMVLQHINKYKALNYIMYDSECFFFHPWSWVFIK